MPHNEFDNFTVPAETLALLTSQIDVSDTSSILRFGADAQTEASKNADELLRADGSESALPLIEDLKETMLALDAPPRFRLFGKTDRLEDLERTADKVAALYTAMRVRESELRAHGERMRRMLLASADAYRALKVYALAAEDGCRQIREYLETAALAPEDRARIQSALTLLERREADLRSACAVTLQTLSMLKLNMDADTLLTEKLAQALKVALPVFRETFATEIRLRRAKLSAESLRVSEQHITDAKHSLRASLEDLLRSAEKKGK